MGLGTRLVKCFVLHNHAVLRHLTNTELLVFDCLFDDDKELSDPIDRSPVRNRSRFLMTFIIGVKSYMRVTIVTLDTGHRLLLYMYHFVILYM